MGATVALNVRNGKLREVQERLGMVEGFDVGLEMSGNPSAFRDMIDNLCHGGRIAMLGIPSEPMAIDWNKVVFNMLTIRSEEHTSELQSQSNLVCRLLLEKKKELMIIAVPALRILDDVPELNELRDSLLNQPLTQHCIPALFRLREQVVHFGDHRHRIHVC